MGLGANIQATPAVALGAYEMTPIDVAAGYTAFAANGVRSEPLFIRSVVAGNGSTAESNSPSTRAVLDLRVAFDDQPDGGRDQSRHRLSGAADWICRARRREDRHFARWLVRRIHVNFVRRVDWVHYITWIWAWQAAKLPAILGRVHEARRGNAKISRHSEFRSAARHC